MALPGERKRGAQSAGAVGGAIALGGPAVSKVAEMTPFPKMIERGIGSIFGTRDDTIRNQADLEVLARLKKDQQRKGQNLDDLINTIAERRGVATTLDKTLPVRVGGGVSMLDDKPIAIPDLAGAETRGLAAYTSRYPGAMSKAEEFLETREGGQGS